MSLQRQFEGPDVRALLDEICATYGPEPTIARAESFRTGGVLGFFQREHYRLVVDEASQPLAAAAPTVDAPVTAPVSAGLPGRARAATAPVDPFAFLADATVDDTFVAGPAPVPAGGAPVPAAAAGGGDGQPTFDTVLHRVARLVEPPAANPVSWPALAGDAVADEVGSYHTGAYDTGAYDTGAYDTAGVPTDETLGLYRPPAVGAPATITDLLASAAAAAAGAPAPAGPGAVAAPATGDAFPAVSAPKDIDSPSPRPVAVLRFRSPAAPEAPTGTRAPAARDERDAGPAAAPRPTPLAERLLRMGLHADDVAGVERSTTAGFPLEGALLEVMDSYPAAPRLPRRAGSLVVVIGPGRRASAEAARIAGEIGTDPAGVAFATERRPMRPTPEELLIHSADDALELAPGHRRGRVGMVAVDAAVGTPAAWARHVVDALRPTQVVAVVDAMHKSEDIADWIEAVGGVDALIVDNVAATVSPARILELGVPVSRLGDAPSTPARWVAALSDRMHATRPGAVGDELPADDRPAHHQHDHQHGHQPVTAAGLELAGVSVSAGAGDRRWP